MLYTQRVSPAVRKSEEKATHLQNLLCQSGGRPTYSPQPSSEPSSHRRRWAHWSAQGAPINDSDTCAPTSRLPTSALASVPGSVSRSTDELFEEIMKGYLKAQTQPSSAPNQTIEPRERSLELSSISTLGSPPWSEDHFDTARATGDSNQTSLAASFLPASSSFQWTQHKRCHQGEGVVPTTGYDFKAFLEGPRWSNKGGN